MFRWEKAVRTSGFDERKTVLIKKGGKSKGENQFYKYVFFSLDRSLCIAIKMMFLDNLFDDVRRMDKRQFLYQVMNPNLYKVKKANMYCDLHKNTYECLV